MIRKLLLLATVLAVIIGFYFFFQSDENSQQVIRPAKIIDQNQGEVAPAQTVTSTIFVPYWAVVEGENSGEYDRSVYFGIAPTANGINKQEQGYLNLEEYTELFSSGERLLAIRMLNSNLNLSILENSDAQEGIIADSLEAAREYGFSGIVLDLELSGLSGFLDEEIPGQINSFAEKFAQRSKTEGLYFAMTIYGDVFYRLRPFDVATLAEDVDELMIMTYDFSKSKGEPGPNFPLTGKEKYGYDLQTLLSDLATVVPREKLSFIFGMYGYDWTVDERQRPVKPAEALSVNEIKKDYLDICSQKNCVVLKDELSKETEINFVDSRNVAPSGFVQNHIIWFEDLESAKKKQEYLINQGVGNFGYWALGYF